MENRFTKMFIMIFVLAIIVPQIVFAVWWNPFSWHWGWLNNIFHFQQTTQQALQQQEQEQQENQDACKKEGEQCGYSFSKITGETACESNWVCSWGPCVNGQQQQSGHDLNVCDGGYGGWIEKQTENCSPLTRACSPSIAPRITDIQPVDNKIWQIGHEYKVKFNGLTSGAGYCIAGFLINSNGEEFKISSGQYLGDAYQNGLTFGINTNSNIYSSSVLGIYSDIVPGTYEIELKTYICAEGFHPYDNWGKSSDIITVVANPDFVKPLITQIVPIQGKKDDIITIYGDNLLTVYSVIIEGNDNTKIVSKDKTHVVFKLVEGHGFLKSGEHKVSVMSTGVNGAGMLESNQLDFKITD
jgi:hypothetical protein